MFWDHVAGEERNDAVAHAGGEVHAGEHHEPDRAERIADRYAKRHGQAEVLEVKRELMGERADDQRAEDIAQNVAARLAEEHRRAAAKAGEHRHADDAQQCIDEHRQRAVFPPQQRAAQVHGEQREVNRNHRQGNLNLGANRGQRGHQRAEHEAARRRAAGRSGIFGHDGNLPSVNLKSKCS